MRTDRSVRLAPAFAALVVVAVVLAGCASVSGRSTGIRTGTRSPGPLVLPSRAASSPSPAAGWRFESSLGMVIAVPDAWRINDTGCGQDARPTVIRGSGPVLACLTPTPITKEYAQIAEATAPVEPILGDDAKLLTPRSTTVSGVAATTASGPVSNGMYAGWIVAPDRDVALYVRTRTRSTLDAILSSAIIEPPDGADINDCPVARPSGRPSPPSPPSSLFVPNDVTTATVCYYGDQTRIQASTVRIGTAARSLAAALNKTSPGTYIGPGSCEPVPVETDALIVLSGPSGRAVVVATFQSCRFRLDNGRAYHQLHQAMLAQIMQNTYLGYTTPDT